MSQSWSQSPAPPVSSARISSPPGPSVAFKLRLLVRRWSPLPSLDGVAPTWSGRSFRRGRLKRLVEGADASSTPPASSRRAGQPTSWPSIATARQACRRWLPRRRFLLLSSLAAPRTAALALCREQARGGGGGAPADRDRGSRSGHRRVYGPGDARRWPTSRRRPRSRAAAQGGRCRLSLIHVADLAEALALALDRRRPVDLRNR
jgi:hypothetical protein